MGRFLSEDPAAGDPLNPPSLHRYLYAYQNPTVYTDPSGEIALIDNLIGGVFSVGVGLAVAAITGEEYSWTDAGVDFAVGALSSGLSSIAKLQKLGKVAQVASKVAIEASVDVAGEAVRAELKGQDFTLGDAAQTALFSVGGQAVAAGAGKLAKKGANEIAERFGQKVAAAADDFPTGRAAGGADAPSPTRAAAGDADPPSAGKSQSAGDPPPPPAAQTKTAGAVTAEGPSGNIEAGSNPSVRSAEPALPPARGPPSQSEIRERVLRNIDDSRTARAASRFDVPSPSPRPLATSVASPSRWQRGTFEGRTIFKRNDLIDPLRRDSRGRTNLQRMEAGIAPVGPDGKSINLHHTIQTETSSIAELTATFHQRYSRVIHINPNTVPSGINRREFDAFRRRYWSDRAKDFKP